MGTETNDTESKVGDRIKVVISALIITTLHTHNKYLFQDRFDRVGVKSVCTKALHSDQ